jgi:TolA-binding protein
MTLLSSMRLPHKIAIALIAFLSGCITPQREREMRNEIFNLQTRLMELERAAREKGEALSSSSEQANQRIASTSSQLDKLHRDLAKINGEIDALKIGVTTGKLPGTDPAEESIATAILDIQQRLGAIEEKQKELEEALASKSSGAKSPAKTAGKDEAGPSNKSVRAAFKAKNFQQVIESGPEVISKTKDKKVRLEMIYYLAESYFKTGKLRDSALKFNEFVDGGGSGEQLPFAKMRLGDCFRGLGDNATAKLYYEDVVKNHSRAPEAERSKQRLTEIGAKGA